MFGTNEQSEAEVLACEREVDRLSKALDAAEADSDMAKTEAVRLRLELGEAHGELERRTAWSNDQIAQRDKRIEEFTAEVRRLELRETTLEGQCAEYRERIEELQAVAINVDMLTADLAAEREKAEANIRAIAESWRVPCERAEARIAELTAANEQTHQALAISRGEVEMLTEENNQLIAQVAELRDELRRYQPSDGVMFKLMAMHECIADAAELLERSQQRGTEALGNQGLPEAIRKWLGRSGVMETIVLVSERRKIRG